MDKIFVPSELASKRPEFWSIETRRWYIQMEWSLRVMFHDIAEPLTGLEQTALEQFVAFQIAKTPESKQELLATLSELAGIRTAEALESQTEMSQFIAMQAEWMVLYSGDIDLELHSPP